MKSYYKLLYNLAFLIVIASQLTACPAVLSGGAVAGGAMAADRRTAGVYVEDENIELKAQARLQPVLGKTAHINVTSYNQRVLLTGEVPDAKIKAKAESITKAVEHVRSVTNELVISAPTSLSSRSGDAYITSKVKTKFFTENRFHSNYVKIVTENSVVFLLGIVTQKEASDAVDIARKVSGVTRVVKVFEYLS
ncbi:MAG: BON domain-containing protein [Methylophilaceae bacterium]|nr:BON domain-containing protein [Methylophilaceae bacterium]